MGSDKPNQPDQTNGGEPEVAASEGQVDVPEGAAPPVDMPTGPVNRPREAQIAPAPSTPPVQKPAAKADDKPRGLDKFLKLTGVKKEDLVKYDPDRLVGVTSQGGKYEMNTKGTQVRHLAGPRPPSVSESDAEAERQAQIEARENAQAGE